MKIGYPAAGVEGEYRRILSNDFKENGLVGIYDVQTETTEVFTQEELGKSIIDWLIDNNISAVVTPELSVMALKVFVEQGLKVYKADNSYLEPNIQRLLCDCLPLFSVLEEYKEGASCSSSSCSKCSSTCN